MHNRKKNYEKEKKLNLTLSVIIPTMDRFTEIQTCIDSIFEQTILPETFIVVDASDKSGLKEILEEKLKNSNIEFIYIKSKPGLAYQRNLGIKENKNDLVLFLDDDIILEDTFIEEIKKVVENDKAAAVGAVTAKITNVKKLGVVSTIIRKIFCLSENGKGEVKKSWANNSFMKLNKISEIQWLPSGCTAYRREVFEHEIFDNNLFGYSYMEDFDISYRIGKRFKLIYNPFAKCVHNHQSSFSTRLKSKEKQNMYMKNYQYLFKKNMPQTFTYKFCHYWSYLGRIIVGLILQRDFDFVVGTIKGIFTNILGKNELVKKL